MGRWKEHKLSEILLLGRSYRWLDKKIDWPYKILGREHRILFHDKLYTHIIAVKYGVDAALAHRIHLKVDYNRRWGRFFRELARIIYGKKNA